jgi:hypothetical protein
MLHVNTKLTPCSLTVGVSPDMTFRQNKTLYQRERRNGEKGLFRILTGSLLLMLQETFTRNICIEKLPIVIAICTSMTFGLLHVINFTNPNI